MPNSIAGVPITLSQTLPTLAEAGTYTLSFFVADRFHSNWLNYEVELLAGGIPILSEDSALNSALRPFNGSTSHPSGVLLGAEGDWLNVVLSGNTTESMLGLPLTLRFISTSKSNEGGPHFDFSLDNVQLSFVPVSVPEPASWLLLAGGGMALGCCVRRRKQPLAAGGAIGKQPASLEKPMRKDAQAN